MAPSPKVKVVPHGGQSGAPPGLQGPQGFIDSVPANVFKGWQAFGTALGVALPRSLNRANRHGLQLGRVARGK